MSTTRSLRRPWLALALLATAFFMTILQSTIVITALPNIGRDLGLDGAGLTWVVTAYVLVGSGLLLFCGRAADLLGRRRVFLAGNALWVVSSLACGLAWSAEVLIAARAVQGLAAAVVAPSALSILMVTFPEGRERNKALGIWGGLGGVGATAGLLFGGVITEGLGWPWIFFVNIPVGAAVLAIAPALLGESRVVERPRSFDAAGAVTVTAALTVLVFAIVTVAEVGWVSWRTLGLFGAVIALATLFVGVENRSVAPLVPFRALRSRVLVGGNLLILAAGMSVDGMLITLTSYVQRVLGWSALEFGGAAAVMTVTSVGCVAVGQHAVSVFGPRPVAIAGTVVLGAACLLLTLTTTVGGSPAAMFAALVIFGVGLGGAFVSAQIAALTGVAEENSGLAAGLVNTSFDFGAALGVAICSSVALARTAAVGGPELLALTDGYRAGFGAAGVFAVLGLVAALALFSRVRAKVPTRSSP